MSHSGGYGRAVAGGSFGFVSAAERRQADLFFADLLGRPSGRPRTLPRFDGRGSHGAPAEFTPYPFEGNGSGAPVAAPTATRPVPPPPPPPSPTVRPAPAVTPVPSPAPAPGPTTTLTLVQPEVDRLAAVQFANAADIDAFFSRRGATGFIDWFNASLGGRAPFVRARGSAIRMQTTPLIRRRFASFWDNIRVAYDRPRITALDFAGLMCIVLNETGGNFHANPERCGGGRSDARGRHPGLAYAFDAIVDVKASYNTLRGNRRAGALFNDPDYIRAHGTLALADRLANRGGDYGGAWNSPYYPQGDFPTDESLELTGFVMQADFYKFRGRGVIQTTSREAYVPAVEFIQRYTGADAVLNDFKRRWTGMSADVAATVSRTDEWDTIFGQGEMLAQGVRLHAGTGNRDYRRMSTDARVLLEVPSRPPRIPRGTPGSIYFMGRRISGRYSYGAGLYRDRVLTMLRGMLPLT